MNDPHTYFNLGTALSRIDNIDGAIKAYRMVLELDPNYQAVYRYLGGIPLKTAEYQDVVEMLRHVVEITPNDLIALKNLG